VDRETGLKFKLFCVQRNFKLNAKLTEIVNQYIDFVIDKEKKETDGYNNTTEE